ncbi:dipeptide ABC transporter ATP-binding protein [Eoetvoesiella caeni]|uniref:Peptide/nickel transport system ATP-binding protein n=1 Tax=Eoetvoesiella caeni TaxID=645616 RepID=A0A366H7Y2_9BURK|nr:ABC transporter ATP-binding protein [Eoetvoesiella caeni]MCI2809839.1 ABC transporter ATP-binding protein [Eoetvoesiella caeni]NYT56246.1 ABC transporter ATP-binding protein [Eoetvoesiella caeni]RBP38303.1 peptide/nickel transport system ATP-binding protein [Eoetvoesiella caeni]
MQTTAAVPNVLSIENLTIALPAGADRRYAVRHISFDVAPGKVVCLVGESGSGKSVIASAVMGLLPEEVKPQAGSIKLQGTELVGASADKLRSLRGTSMAMVFQEPMTALNPVMTCGAQVDEMLARHVNMAPAQRKARILEIFRHVKLPDPDRVFSSYPHQLSGGQRQRIVIAIALILKPALLICDEPTTALDVTTQAEILKLILELQNENGTAVLFITHDFGVVAEIADEVVVLQLGDMVEKGPKLDVLTRPQEAYTKMLLKAVPELGAPQRPPLGNAVPLLDVRNLSKTYKTGSWPGKRRIVQAAKDISLSIRPGETLGIVGESGSGKSTVARCIARLIDPTSGDIISGEHSFAHLGVKHLSALRRLVQVIFQDPYRSLNPRQTVGASIIEGPINFGIPRDQAWARAEELMTLVRLSPDALRRYPSEFSGGQRQRISIARALACEPKILIADEAVSALDVSVQAQILDLLADIQQRLSIGILFITHDLRVASQICDRVIVMSQGEVVEQGEIKDVFFAPQHAYTKTLLAAAPGQGFSFAGAV